MARSEVFFNPHFLRIVPIATVVAMLPSFAAAQATGNSACADDGKTLLHPVIPVERKADESMLPSVIQAEQITGRPDREVNAERNVEITRGPMQITSDKATYQVVEDQVSASGNIQMKRNGDHYTGDELQLKVEAGKGFVTNPTYFLHRNDANGSAKRINFEGEDKATIVGGTYSTCDAPDPDWYLKADTLHLDNARDEGVAEKSVLYFKDVPILGAPKISFPLSGERKSGVLPPSIGTTSKGGLEIDVPYYFNIAPNRDLTLYPNAIWRRGLQLGADGRYIGNNYSGETLMEFLPHDRQTGTDRYAVSSKHAQILGPGWSGSWDWNGASDINYSSDFARTITAAFQPLLWRNESLNYSSTYWRASALVSSFQLLQDPSTPISLYKRLPQLTLNAARMDVNGFDWGVDSEASSFWNSQLVSGTRIYTTPYVSYPFLRPGYFITPKISFDMTHYQLDNLTGSTPSSLNRALPIFSLDSGLVFERDASFFGESMTQTLEPRVFYVRAPYRNQDNYPVFDTALTDLNFAQLFSENRFIGHDRIADANQVTTAVTSRYIQEDGQERMRLSLGQRFHFSTPRVTLASVAAESKSDLVFSGSGSLNPSLSAETNFQYSESLHRMDRSDLGVQWQPAPKHVFNFFYRRDMLVDPNRKEIEASTEWPLLKRWYAVGRVNYSLQDKALVEGLIGAEYKANCWVFRMVAQRTPTGLISTGQTQATSTLFFQLELNGLARLGSNPLDALHNSIPGYQLINRP